MILYNVHRKFFALKGDAEPHRKELGLPPETLHKMDIKNAVHLVEFLNDLCAPEPEKMPELAMTTEEEVAAMIVVDEEAIPDCVPAFLKKSWGKS